MHSGKLLVNKLIILSFVSIIMTYNQLAHFLIIYFH